MRWTLKGGSLLVLVALSSAWWFLIAGSDAADSAPEIYPIEQWREELLGDDVTARPTEIRLIEVGSDYAPRIAAQAGELFSYGWHTTYGAFQIVTPSGSIFVDSGIDAETSEIMARSPETSVFDQAEYDAFLSSMEDAQHFLLTHAHRDHVMGVARHPNPAAIAPILRLNAPQKSVLGGFTKSGTLPAAYAEVPPYFDRKPKQLAPGVLVSPSPGHTPGSQVIYVTLQDGREYLFVGDIVWTITNIVVFEPNEDREALKQQVRALHDLSQREANLTILPSHDRDYLMGLIEAGAIGMGLQR